VTNQTRYIETMFYFSTTRLGHGRAVIIIATSRKLLGTVFNSCEGWVWKGHEWMPEEIGGFENRAKFDLDKRCIHEPWSKIDSLRP
jgi:hypothetical protein